MSKAPPSADALEIALRAKRSARKYGTIRDTERDLKLARTAQLRRETGFRPRRRKNVTIHDKREPQA